MKRYSIENEVIHTSLFELYQLGWNGKSEEIATIIKNNVLYGDSKVSSVEIVGNTVILKIEMYTLMFDRTVDNGITQIPCPVCDGYGEVEVSAGSHSISQKCDYCDGGIQSIDNIKN